MCWLWVTKTRTKEELEGSWGENPWQRTRLLVIYRLPKHNNDMHGKISFTFISVLLCSWNFFCEPTKNFSWQRLYSSVKNNIRKKTQTKNEERKKQKNLCFVLFRFLWEEPWYWCIITDLRKKDLRSNTFLFLHWLINEYE